MNGNLLAEMQANLKAILDHPAFEGIVGQQPSLLGEGVAMQDACAACNICFVCTLVGSLQFGLVVTVVFLLVLVTIIGLR